MSGIVGRHFLGLQDDDTTPNDSVLLLKLLDQGLIVAMLLYLLV